MVQLSYWREGRLLLDPVCGSGTIPIEAALIGRNIAPGLKRKFAAEAVAGNSGTPLGRKKKAAFDAIKNDADIKIQASDISPSAIKAAREKCCCGRS